LLGTKNSTLPKTPTFFRFQKIDLSDSRRISKIHENAFGFSNGSRYRTLLLETFQVSNCNISVFPERLLPWEILRKIEIGGNPLDCSRMHYFIYDLNIHTLSGKPPAMWV
jgi:hypothetical protein